MSCRVLQALTARCRVPERPYRRPIGAEVVLTPDLIGLHAGANLEDHPNQPSTPFHNAKNEPHSELPNLASFRFVLFPQKRAKRQSPRHPGGSCPPPCSSRTPCIAGTCGVDIQDRPMLSFLLVLGRSRRKGGRLRRTTEESVSGRVLSVRLLIDDLLHR